MLMSRCDNRKNNSSAAKAVKRIETNVGPKGPTPFAFTGPPRPRRRTWCGGVLERDLSELGFHALDQFVFALKALKLLNDAAVARDDKAGGVPEDAAEFVGGFIGAQQDRIAHRQFLAVDIEALLFYEGSNDALSFVIHSDANNGEAPGAVLFLHRN